MITHEYRLTFTTPVHFGIEGIGQERIEERGRSDTLWGAIIQQWLRLYPSEDPEELCQNTPFLVSSCFPLIKGVPFYPLPLGALDHLFTEVTENKDQRLTFKELKKISFISKAVFFDLIQGKRLLLTDIHPDTVYPLSSDLFDSLNGQAPPFFSVQQRPRLRIDQLSGGAAEGVFFYCADQYFNSDQASGLFFLVSFQTPEARSRFEGALRLLGDTGLGGDRSVGRGLFTFTVTEENNLPAASNSVASSYLLLSLFHPTEIEVGQGILEGPAAAYSLIKRSGHSASPRVSPYRRSDLWMLEEGSVVPQEPKGDVVCVLQRSETIPHNVYRCGQAFSIPVQLHR